MTDVSPEQVEDFTQKVAVISKQLFLAQALVGSAMDLTTKMHLILHPEDEPKTEVIRGENPVTT